MTWSEREQKIWHEIESWEQKLFQYEPTDFERTYDKWLDRSLQKLNAEVRENIFRNLDNWLFHLHGLIQGSQSQLDARERLLKEARIFNEEIEFLSDMRILTIDQLIYLAEQQISKYRVLSLTQGGVSGTGSILLLGIDIPAMAVLNLRSTQAIAMTYGYDVNMPFEMMISLKVFHAATLPKRMRASGWQKVTDEVRGLDSQYYLYEGSDELTDESWLEQPLKQILKSMSILMFRKRVVQGVPLISMAIGAGMNYQLSRQVTDFAHRFYQMRYLSEKNTTY